jgi:hypothetical protein
VTMSSRLTNQNGTTLSDHFRRWIFDPVYSVL